MMNQHPLEMGISVVFTGLVMIVIWVGRRNAFHPFINIFQQPVFPIVDENTGCDVHRRHENEPFANLRFLQKFLNFIGDADILSVFLRVEPEIFCVRTQSF